MFEEIKNFEQMAKSSTVIHNGRDEQKLRKGETKT
jgi:hypothetical protein